MENVWDVARNAQQTVLAPQHAQFQNAAAGVGILDHLRKVRQEEALNGILSSAMPGEEKLQMLASGKAGIMGVAAAHQMAQVGEQQAKMQQAAKQREFYSAGNLAKFTEGGAPAQAPVTPNDDEGNPMPGVAAKAGTLNFDKFLQAGASQGVVNPEVYANHLAQRKAAQDKLAQEAVLKREQLDKDYNLGLQRSEDFRWGVSERAQTSRDARAAAIAARPQEPLVAIQGENGPVYVSRADAIGKTPASKSDINLSGGRESVYINRVVQAGNQASKDLENIVKLPMTSSRGFLGGRGQGKSLFEAGKETLANTMTTQDVQSYNILSTGFQRTLAAIEASGLSPNAGLSHQMDTIIFKEGDTNFSKLQKLAQIRQIVESGMESTLANPRIPEETRKHVGEIVTRLQKSVPFTQGDLINLQEKQQLNPNATLNDVVKRRAADSNYPTATDGAGNTMIYKDGKWQKQP